MDLNSKMGVSERRASFCIDFLGTMIEALPLIPHHLAINITPLQIRRTQEQTQAIHTIAPDIVAETGHFPSIAPSV